MGGMKQAPSLVSSAGIPSLDAVARIRTFTAVLTSVLLAASCSEVPLIGELERLVHPTVAPPIRWARTAGGSQTEEVNAVAPTSDGCFLMAGTTRTYVGTGDAARNAWAIKVDDSGEPIWQYSFGGTGDDVFMACGESGDGYLFAGQTTSHGQGGWDLWAVRLDKNGGLKWSRTWGLALNELATPGSVLVKKTGGCIFGGSTYSTALKSGDFLLVSFDDGGVQTYAHYWENLSYYETILQVMEFSDATLLLRKFPSTTANLTRVERTTTDYGNVVKSGEIDYVANFTADGGFVGLTPGSLNGFAVRRYDKDFARIGSETLLKLGGRDRPVSVIQTPTGFLVIGITEQTDEDLDYADDVMVASLTPELGIRWVKRYGGARDDRPVAAACAAGGGYLIAGTTNSWGGGGQDIWILRLDSDGTQLLPDPENEFQEIEPDVGTGTPLPPLTPASHGDPGLVASDWTPTVIATIGYFETQW